MAAAPFEFRTHARNVHSFKFQMRYNTTVQSVMLISDLHLDNPHCDRGLLAEHLDEAVHRNAPIVIVGDALCLMENFMDGRASKNLRHSALGEDYLDRCISEAAEFFGKWQSHIAVIGVGNHETSVNKRCGTDVTARLCQLIRHNGGIAREGGYAGWLRLYFNKGTIRRSDVGFYSHGFGGGSASTRGTGHFTTHFGNQIGGRVGFICAGHVHYKEAFPVAKSILNNSNKIELVTQHCLRLGTYKQECTDPLGFHVQKGRGARVLGGYFLNYTFHKTKGLHRAVEEIQ